MAAGEAVRARRVHLSPKIPFGWVDFPPSVNRLVGLWWLAKFVYPEKFPEDLKRADARILSTLLSRQAHRTRRSTGAGGTGLASCLMYTDATISVCPLPLAFSGWCFPEMEVDCRWFITH